MDVIADTARSFLGLVFALSSLRKLQDLRGFARGVEQFGLLPREFGVVAAMGLSFLEHAISLSLLSGLGARLGLVAAALLLVFFTVLMTLNARRDNPLPCYCFGTGGSSVHPRRDLIRLALLMVPLFLLLLNWMRERPGFLSNLPSIEALLMGMGTLLLGSWLLRLPELREWHRTPMPQFANPGNRLSLRGLPLDPPPSDSH